MSAASALKGVSSTIFSNLFVSLPYPEGDFGGQTIIVTGSNVGLGLEASKHIARLNAAKVILGVRNLQKGEDAKKEILEATGRDGSTVEVWHIDMDSYVSVKDFASRAVTLPRLDALVANAGIATTKFAVSEDNEKTITTNVVSTFLLSMLLLPKLRESAAQFGGTPRIVIPNSALHYVAPLKELEGNGAIFDTLNDPKTADMDSRYPLSKLLVIYALRELHKAAEASQKGTVIVNTPNPSYCKSQLTRETEGFGIKVAEKLLARTTEAGSRALVHGLLAGPESNGQYLTNCHVQV